MGFTKNPVVDGVGMTSSEAFRRIVQEEVESCAAAAALSIIVLEA